MNKKYIVKLTAEEKQQLEQLLNQGKAAARKLTPARILLKANCSQEQGGWTDQAIHQAIDVSLSTIARVRQTFVEQGLNAALQPKPTSQLRLRKLDGVAEARLIACCCSQPPTGRKDQAWYNRGLVLLQLERYEEAIASFDRAIQIRSDEHQLWYFQG